MQKIGVFLSSHDHVPTAFRSATEALGRWISRTHRTLVYGGARCGLMEVLAQTVKQHGGRVYGVVPQILYDRQCVSEHIDVEFRTADLNDRKAVMMRESDILVALPGGVGTLDEVFTVLAADSIGTEQKQVVLFDVDHCWHPLLHTLAEMEKAGLVAPTLHQHLKVVDNLEALEQLCQ